MTDARPHSFQSLGAVASRLVEQIKAAPDGRAPWRSESTCGGHAMVMDADNNPLFHCRGAIADRIVALVNANPRSE